MAILLLASGLSSAQDGGGSSLLFVGTSQGIYAYRFDAASARLSPLGLAAETRNPSFLAADATRGRLYAVNEISDYKGASSGAVSAFAIDRSSGKLSPLNEVPSRGSDPCYIALDKTGKFVLVTNYTGGSVAVFPILDGGQLGEASAFVQHVGRGRNNERQDGPHPHWIETSADNRFAISADLGLDKLLVYRFDPGNGSLVPNEPPATKLEPGAGPRHVAFTPDQKFAYAINELGSSITVFSYDPRRGLLKAFQTISTLPDTFTGDNTTAEILVHPRGRFLYASNRGHDSIALFTIDRSTGRLTLGGHFPSGGKTPRNFTLDPAGTHLLVANQDSGNIVVFRIDAARGRLARTPEVVSLASAVCLTFVPPR
ncbi:MAG: lactonase family protein [Acidobacteria bacterium]|nr:lactonase family protein [Acidobacteriota bacterium]